MKLKLGNLEFEKFPGTGIIKILNDVTDALSRLKNDCCLLYLDGRKQYVLANQKATAAFKKVFKEEWK